MIIIIFIIFATLFIARSMSGYDNRYNDRKYFVLQNKEIAEIILPKSAGWQRSTKRAKVDFNKMTYAGAVFYFCNLLLILSIPIFSFLVPEIQIQPFEFETRYVHILVDTLNQKLPILFSLILLSIEIIFEFLNIISQARKQNKKWMIILSTLLMLIVFLFGLMQIIELISTVIVALS